MEDQANLTLLHELLNQLRFAHWEADPRITVWRGDLHRQVFVAWKSVCPAKLMDRNVWPRLCNAANLCSGRLLLLLMRRVNDWRVAHPGTT
jgi:hypothetical protein